MPETRSGLSRNYAGFQMSGRCRPYQLETVAVVESHTTSGPRKSTNALGRRSGLRDLAGLLSAGASLESALIENDSQMPTAPSAIDRESSAI
jgi:hypothetical protein